MSPTRHLGQEFLCKARGANRTDADHLREPSSGQPSTEQVVDLSLPGFEPPRLHASGNPTPMNGPGKAVEKILDP